MTNKKIPVYANSKIVGWKPMTKDYVERYFRSIQRSVKGVERKSGEYCDRCGVGIGSVFATKEANTWKGWDLCDDCYDKKLEGKYENTPDLEDLLRFELIS